MIINVDNWTVPVESNFVSYVLTYDTSTKLFKVATYGNGSQAEINQANKLYLTVEERGGQLPDELIVTACDGTTLLSFYVQLNYPFAYVTEQQNSATCNYVSNPPPPTTNPPPPVCDLALTVTKTDIQTRNENDGTITASITTTVTGSFTITIYNNTINPDIIVANVVVNMTKPNFVFNNLPVGLYRVAASSNDFSCTDEETISVLPFAFNERFYFLFCETRFDKRQIRLSIKQAGFGGLSTQIEVAGRTVAEIQYPSVDSQNKFFTLMGSECNINLIANEVFDLEDIYTDTEGKYLLELTFQSTNDPIWSGYILPDTALEPFKSYPYEVTISATDGIKVLNDIDFDKREGRLTFLEGLKYALDKTNIKLGFKTMCDIINAQVESTVLLTGLMTNVYGLQVVINTGSWKINGVTFTKSNSETFTFASITDKKIILLYLMSENNTVFSIESSPGLSPRTPRLPEGALLLATVIQNNFTLTLKRELLFIDDTFANHTFDVKRFIKNDGTFTDCYTVIEYLCKQFTCQIKQSNGFWVIENIGYKGRDVTLLESAYDNELIVLYANQIVTLLVDIDCNAEGLTLGGGSLSIGSGHKKETVIQKIGLPVPVISNFGFELWDNTTGTLLPVAWNLSQPYNYFDRGAKFDRFYNPTTGEIILKENGSYYFNMLGTEFNSAFVPKDYVSKKVGSSSVAVFNQEIITLSFQAIVNNPTFGLPIFTNIYFNLGIYRFVNYYNGSIVEPKWVVSPTINDSFYIEIANDDQKPPYGDSTNVSIDTLPAPIQGYLNITFSEHFLGTKELILYSNERFSPRNEKITLGFDNFKISKKSPVSGAIIIDEETFEILNTNKFSTIPDDFEVFFTDVDNLFRTDGIKTVAGIATTGWKRKSIDEAETIAKIIVRELLSQYQTSYKMFEGSVMANNISIRSIFNLPTLDLFKFVPTSMTLNLIECTADVNIVEIYAMEGLNSGPIGGGGGGSGGNVNDDGFVLGFKNFIFTDGNNNIIGSDGI